MSLVNTSGYVENTLISNDETLVLIKVFSKYPDVFMCDMLLLMIICWEMIFITRLGLIRVKL